MQLADAIVTVALSRAVEIVNNCNTQDHVTMVTIEALDLAGLEDFYRSNKGEEKEGNKDTYSTQLPWLRGKLFDTSEAFQGLQFQTPVSVFS